MYCVKSVELFIQVIAGVKDSWLKSTLLQWALQAKADALKRYFPFKNILAFICYIITLS